MSILLENLATTAVPEETIDVVVRRMAKDSKNVVHQGLAVILDEKGCLLGVITDGDVRRAYAGDVEFSEPVSKIMVNEPITISTTTPNDQVASEVIRKVQLDDRHDAWVRHVLVTDDNNKFINIVDFFDVMQRENGSVKKVVVFGMGYVGLTLSVALANRGHQVSGIDINSNLIDQLNAGQPHVHEPGLDQMLNINLSRKKIRFLKELDSSSDQVYIVAVGTPLNKDYKPDLMALSNVVEMISSKIKIGDHVVLRSTVPVGTTREIVIPILESRTGLKTGEDFFVSFAPERTIEGKAMYELKALPQVVGGFSTMCLKKGVEFWSTLTSTVVQMSSLEASELVKLANNTFRDISFAFANELALLADRYNVDAFDLINGANEGYPRNKIPLPSPGVGGYCLTKDPVLFSCTPEGQREDAVLGLSSRIVNERAMRYPVDLIERFANQHGKQLSELSILIMGVAFKGVPETTDVRGSVSVDVKDILSSKVYKLIGWDAVITPEKLQQIGFETEKTLEKAVASSDVILIMNNHVDNIHPAVFQQSDSARLIFDGWSQLDRNEVKKISGLEYATMGYMSA